MGETRLSLSGAEENRVLEGLIVFLTERAEGAKVPAVFLPFFFFFFFF